MQVWVLRVWTTGRLVNFTILGADALHIALFSSQQYGVCILRTMMRLFARRTKKKTSAS